MEDKKSSKSTSKRGTGKTPHYNANTIQAPRYNIKGIGKLGPSLGGLKGAQVSPESARGLSNAQLAKSIGKSLTGLNSASSRKSEKS